MKINISRVLTLATLLSGILAGIAIAQSTNVAPSGVLIQQQASATTSTIYTPAVTYNTPAQSASFASAYLTPWLTASGITLPSGSVPRSLAITFYNDGSTRTLVMPAAPGSLPAPPAITSNNSTGSSNSGSSSNSQ
jgi:hypothetical protein